MFNNESWSEFQRKISLKVQALQELLIAKTNLELSRDLDIPKKLWMQNRLAHTERMKRLFKSEIKRTAKEVRKIAEEGIKYSIDKSTEELIEAVGKPAKEKITRATKIPLKIGLEKMDQKVSGDLQMLYMSAVSDYRATIPKVELDNRGLFDIISNLTREKIENGYVVYDNGRKMTYRSYIEMSVRTEMQQNALRNLEESSEAAGIEVYIASAHADSADDHAPFQGYYYLAEGVPWKDEYDQYNFHPQYKYLKQVKDLGFLTRPNCRHYVMPVTWDQVKQKKSMHRQLGMPNRKQNPNFYDNLQEQRRNERKIRKYKNRVNNDRLLLKNVKDDEQRAVIRGKLKKDKRLVDKWQHRQDELVDKKFLKRDRQRERPGIIVHDMGVRKKKTI